MPETQSILETIPILGKILTGVVGGGIALAGFFGRFQTKEGYKKSQADHDKLMRARDDTRKEEKQHFQTKLDAIHDDVKEQGVLIKKIASDFYVPVTTARDKRG